MHLSAQAWRRGTAVLAAALACLGAGCGGSGSDEARQENHPMMRRALALKHANDIDGAIATYQKHVDRNPGSARAHVQLGMLFDQEPREDYARAVYHYERYLELGRDAKTREYVTELLKRARLSYAASLPDRPSEAIRMIADLRKENAALRQQIQTLANPAPPTPSIVAPTPAPTPSAAPRPAPRAAPPAPTGTAARATALARPSPAPAVAQAQTYTVQAGDTLSVIAGKVYGDPNAWRRIYDANKGLLPDPGSVRPQQVLVIPR